MRMAITRGRESWNNSWGARKGREGVEESGNGKGDADKRYFLVLSSGPSLLKMFTGLLRVKWAANAVTSMQTTTKHNSLIRSGPVPYCVCHGSVCRIKSSNETSTRSPRSPRGSDEERDGQVAQNERERERENWLFRWYNSHGLVKPRDQWRLEIL